MTGHRDQVLLLFLLNSPKFLIYAALGWTLQKKFVILIIVVCREMEHKNAPNVNIDVLIQFPEENPNPVMLTTHYGEIRYYNPHVISSHVPGDHGDMAIIQAMSAMSHALGMKVAAEGVETNAQVEYLKAVGCDYIQGYYYSKPLPLNELISRIDKNYLLLM